MPSSTLKIGFMLLLLPVTGWAERGQSSVDIAPPQTELSPLPPVFSNPYSMEATSIRPPLAAPMEAVVAAPGVPTGMEHLQLEQIPGVFFNPYIAPPDSSPHGGTTTVSPPTGGGVDRTAPLRVAPPGSSSWDVLPQTSSSQSYCGGAWEAEITKEGCPVQPPYVYGGTQRQCAARTQTPVVSRYGQAYADMIHSQARSASEAAGISPAIVLALLDAESGFNPMSSNEGGDTGMAQFQIPTARSTLEYWRSSGASTVALQSYNLETQAPSAECRGQNFFRITRSCTDSLLREDVCGSERVGLRPNLYCPQFAIHLMAWHLKKQSVQPRIHTFRGQQINIASALQGDGDSVSQARYLASRYNRGCLIENSYMYVLERQNTSVSAREYGALWEARPSGSYQNHRARPCASGRVLHTERINRCYMWRVTGLCGGFGDSLVGQYLRGQFCHGGEAGSQTAPFGGVQ